jgi:hypothetical protein
MRTVVYSRRAQVLMKTVLVCSVLRRVRVRAITVQRTRHALTYSFSLTHSLAHWLTHSQPCRPRVSTTTTQVLDPFDVLGLTPGGKGVTAAEVRKAYRKLALSLHPDKAAQNGMDPVTAESRMKEVCMAHHPLCPISQWPLPFVTTSSSSCLYLQSFSSTHSPTHPPTHPHTPTHWHTCTHRTPPTNHNPMDTPPPPSQTHACIFHHPGERSA